MSDLEKVKEESKFLYDLISIQEAVDVCNMDGLIISHPYTNSGITAIKKDGEYKFIDIVHSKSDADLFRKQIYKRIDLATDVWKIELLINKPYLLLWFKLVSEYLDEKDYAKLLADIWVRSENPNNDVNVSLDECIEFFKKANKSILMNEDEYKVYSDLPDMVHVYRGVSKGRNPKGLSYTLNKDKAIWFQNRYADKDNKGFLIEKDIKKENILAFFSSRDEAEIVIDTRK